MTREKMWEEFETGIMDVIERWKERLEQEPNGDAVSRDVFEQVRWERDVAIAQLKDLGYSLGEKIEPCEDAISRQAVMDCFKKWQPYMATRLWWFEQELSELPSVNPQEQTGQWKRIGYDIYECSKCGQNVQTGDICAYKHCHGCGEKMVEPQESEDKG